MYPVNMTDQLHFTKSVFDRLQIFGEVVKIWPVEVTGKVKYRAGHSPLF